jgi:hypothetical protein
MRSGMSTTGTHSRGAIDAEQGILRESYSMNIGFAFLQILDDLFQALLFRGVHIHEFHAKIITGCPGHSGPAYLNGFLVCRDVHTDRDGRTNLYMGSAFNSAAAQGEVEEFPLSNALISLERNRKLHLHAPLSPLFHWHAPPA